MERRWEYPRACNSLTDVELLTVRLGAMGPFGEQRSYSDFAPTA